MRLLVERMSSFAMGVNDSAAPDEYLPQQVQSLINARASLHGNTIETIPGQEELASSINVQGSGVSNCYGAIEFHTAAGAQQIVAAFDDEMHFSTDGGLTFTQITGATSLREDYWSFKIIREGSSNVLCCANGGTNSYQYDGTTWSTISGIPSGTKYLGVMGNRLWAAGGNGITVAASVVGDIDDWSAGNGALSVVAATNDGDTEVKGLFQLGSVLLVFKRESIGYIEGFGYQTLQVETGARGVSRSIGCVAHRTIAPLGDHGVMWLSQQGFCAYFIGGAVQIMSENQQRFVDAISFDVIRQHEGIPSATWYPRRQEYVCAVPVYVGLGSAGLGDTRNNWLYYFRPGTQTRPSAAYMRHPTTSLVWSLEIDADGELDVLVNDLTGLRAKINKHGELDVTSLPDPGDWVTTVSGELTMRSGGVTIGDSHPNALFTADRAGETGALMSGTHGNAIVALESDTPDADPVAIVVPRPMLFGDEFTRKKAKRVTVLADQDGSRTGTVAVRADGVLGAEQSLAYTSTIEAGPQERRARVGGRGRVLQIEYRVEGLQTISGFELVAQLMGDQV